MPRGKAFAAYFRKKAHYYKILTYYHIKISQEKFYTGIESEKAAINQYRMHMKMIQDDYVNAVLARIIRDEECHIMLLQALSAE